MNTMAKIEKTKKKMAPDIWAPLNLQLTLIIIIISIQLHMLSAEQVKDSWKGATHTKRRSAHESDINSGCDLLFAANTHRALDDFCQCRDSTAFDQGAPGALELQPPTAPNDDLSSSARAAAFTSSISQLDCRHDNASELLGALSHALASQQQRQKFKLDYLNIQTNVPTYESAQVNWHHKHSPQVDQLTATLTMIGSARTSNAENLLSTLTGQFLTPNQLQSLTLVIIQATTSKESEEVRTPPIKVNKFLDKLAALSRLEISVLADDNAHQGAPTLELDSASLEAQSRSLQWLNLASNNQLNLTAMPLAHLNALKYLNLESSHLSAFHLFEQFGYHNSQQTFAGMNLSSLNLAKNELSSLESDLFCCWRRFISNSRHAHFFQLPSLSQLDLSYNRLRSISIREAHLVLVSFPQLANLYLQHNQIVHLNLDALLGTSWSQLTELQSWFGNETGTNKSITVSSLQSVSGPVGQSSKLEFIDLSHNELTTITALSQAHDKQSDGVARIRSINLAHNRLGRPISLISQKFINLLVFAESFENHIGLGSPIVNLNTLDSIFDLKTDSYENVTNSLCDYLSIGMQPLNDDNLLAELLLDHNNLERLELGDFASASCQGLETLALNDNSLAHIAPGAFNSMIRLQRLDLSGNQLTELSEALFDHLLELRILNLAGNRLTRLAVSFSIGPAQLQELYLQNNALESWQVGANSTQLKIVDLSNNKLALHEKTPSALNHLNELTYLNLQGNNQLKDFNWLTLFGEEKTVSVTGQNELQVDLPDERSDKRTKKRRKGVLQRAKSPNDRRAQRRRSARSLADAQHNADHLPDATTQTTIELNLRDNRLVTFGPPSATTINHCDQLTTTMRALQVLDASQNWLKELTNNSFVCFHQLEQLDLSSNHLRTLNEFAFEQLTHLRHLSVANNYLAHVGANLLNRRLVPIARHLDFSGNQISSLSFSTLNESIELDYLDLSDNYNLKLDTSELLNLMRASSASLRHLKLARIASIWTNVALNESSLQFELDLESLDLGQVSRVDSNMWKYLTSGRMRVEKLALCLPQVKSDRENLMKLLVASDTNLRELDLSECQLSSSLLEWTLEAALTSNGETAKNNVTSGLIKLNLSHNKLSEWPEQLLGIFARALAHLDLSDNKLSGRLFGPRNHGARTDLNQLKSLNLSSNSLTNIFGDTGERVVVGLMAPRLRHLDLSHNKLTSLPSDLFDQWQHLEMLWLSHNQLTSVLVAPSLGERDKLASLVSRLRLLDLSFNAPPNGKLPSIVQTRGVGQFEGQDEIEGKLSSSGTTSGLIIHKDTTSAAIGCSQLSDFIRNARRDVRPSVNPKVLLITTSYAIKENYLSDDQSSGQADESEAGALACPIREVRLDNSSNWSGLNLVNLQEYSAQVALSSTGNQIGTLAGLVAKLTPRSRARVIYLDLSRNDLESSSSSLALEEICAHFANLQTLEATHQTNLQEVSLHQFAGVAHESASARAVCSRLAYVNLSNNKLRLFKLGRAMSRPLDSLRALKLDNNQLKTISDDILLALPNLRYLNLRHNQIAQVSALDILTSATLNTPLLDIILDQQVPLVNRYEVKLTRDMQTLQIGSATPTANKTFSLEVFTWARNSTHRVGSVQYHDSHVLRFCTLNRVKLYQVCLDRSKQVASHAPVCFALRPPPRGPSCTTNIANELPDLVATSNNISEPTRTESLMSSYSVSNKTSAQLETNEDPVLSFIDQLKWAWLRLKQFDLAAYLAQVSQVKQDSVLVTINGRHPIYTLTVIKFGLVLAALCVILLSIAMFALLTATVMGGGGGGGASSKRQKLRRQNKIGDGSMESSYDQDATSPTGKVGEPDDDTTTTSGGRATKSEDTSEGSYSRRTTATTSSSSQGGVSSNQMGTVREQHRLQVASATTSGHHLFQANCCSTPSSSLAPSSVETGETMQAVDSLQSCSFTRDQRQEIYDSQRTLTASSHAHFNSVDQYQQEQQQGQQMGVRIQVSQGPVATVMRMVKSSTFDGLGASMVPGRGIDSQHGAHYGTLRNQQQPYAAGGSCNYPSLARPRTGVQQRAVGHTSGTQVGMASNRLRSEQQQQQQRQIYVPAQSVSFGGGGGELDPATLSLLSLNSQLSGGGSGSGYGANNGGGEQVTGGGLSVPAATSLCQYHTRQQAMQRARDQQQDHRELLLSADELQQHRHHSSATGAHGTLFELDEELLLPGQVDNWQTHLAVQHDRGCEQEEADYPLAPPPPPPPSL